MAYASAADLSVRGSKLSFKIGFPAASESGSSASRPRNAFASSRCPVDDTGRYSVSPSTNPNTSESQYVIPFFAAVFDWLVNVSTISISPFGGSDSTSFIVCAQRVKFAKDAISKRRRIFIMRFYLAGMRLDEKWLERLSRFERAFYCHGIRKAELAAAGESKAYAR